MFQDSSIGLLEHNSAQRRFSCIGLLDHDDIGENTKKGSSSNERYLRMHERLRDAEEGSSYQE